MALAQRLLENTLQVEEDDEMQAFDLVIRGGLRIGQTCFERSDGFDLISLPLFHDVDLAAVAMGHSLFCMVVLLSC
jgi:hypothetical protein